MIKIIVSFFPILLLLSACTTPSADSTAEEIQSIIPNGEYFGQTASMEAQLFAEGIVSREFQELNAVFSPDGNEFYYTIADAGRSFYTIVYYKKNTSGAWEGPQVAPFSGSYSDADPFITSDGQRLYFISKRPLDASTSDSKDFDIWMVEKKGNDWSSAVNLGAPINTEKNEYYVSVTDAGSIFYSSNYEGGVGSSDVYEAKLVNGKYKVENLGDKINSKSSEGDPYISPDGNMIIFMSWGRQEGLGSGDLYISYKKNGEWQAAKNLSKRINTESFEYCPMLSPDGKYFFWTSYQSSPFHSKTPRTYDSYIERLNTSDNGLGNVYWIKSEVLQEIWNQ